MFPLSTKNGARYIIASLAHPEQGSHGVRETAGVVETRLRCHTRGYMCAPAFFCVKGSALCLRTHFLAVSLCVPKIGSQVQQVPKHAQRALPRVRAPSAARR